MNTDDAMRKVTAAIDSVISDALADAVSMVVAKGATEEEVESFRAWYAQQLAHDRASKLRDAYSWLQHRGETLQ